MHSAAESSITSRLATVMLNATNEERGTLANLSSLSAWMSDLEKEQDTGKLVFTCNYLHSIKTSHSQLD